MNNILISLSPNTSKEDVSLACKRIFKPSLWKKGESIQKLENKIKNFFTFGYAISFNSGRSALFVILKALGINSGDEVIIQPFTCVAVPNAVIWTGANPVYADISKNSFNISPKQIKKKITSKTKAVIVQHTFGQPAAIDEIRKICDKKKLFLVEDCAHCLGQKYKGRLLGSFGDAAMLSFGRDKVVSSVFGGMAITNIKKIGTKIRKYQQELAYPNDFWIFQQLLHPVAFYLIKPLYNLPFKSKFTFGKLILFILQKLKLLSFPVCQCEKVGKKPDMFPKKLPNAMASLVIKQFNKIDEMNKKRRKIVKSYLNQLQNGIYKSNNTLLRFPYLTSSPEELIDLAKNKGILLGNWYRPVIAPQNVNLNKVGYKKGTCPRAEKASREIVNLPTYPGLKNIQISEIIYLIKCWQQKK